jgi:hypothetical protein
MSVAEFQACLSRLYLSAPFRRVFQLEPDAALAGYELNDAEKSALLGVDRDELRRVADSLLAKRRADLERGFPLLFGMLNAAVVERWVERYHAIHADVPGVPHTERWIQFGRFMEATLGGAAEAPPFAGDLARYERLRNAAAAEIGTFAQASYQNANRSASRGESFDAGARVRRRRGMQHGVFAYDVARIAGALESNRVDGVRTLVADGPHEYLFVASDDERVYVLAITSETKLLVDLCDGRRTVAEIIDAYRAGASPPVSAEVVRDTLQRLLELQVLEV